MTPRRSIRECLQDPEQKKAYNAGLFTRVAAEYDLATRAMSLGRDRRWKRRLVARLPELRAPRCVDLACGTGDVALALARKYPEGEIIGVDLTPSMLELARARVHGENIRFLQRDMCRLELPDGWADIVTGSYALRNAPVLEKAVAEIRRVLKPGGWAGFLDFSKFASQPWQAMQLALLKLWGGGWGIIIHGRPEHAYIAESLRQFPDCRQCQARLKRSGFQLVHQESFMLGFLKLLIVRKQDLS